MASDQPRVLSQREWPARLLDLGEAPGALYLSGSLPGPPFVAIVGTRRPSVDGLAFAHELAGDLARAGVCVVSGGALGIDAAVHRGALDAGGRTLVVAPAGWNKPFPPELASLFQEVVDRGGGYLSLCAPDDVATRARFFSRNACLVALAHVVIVVEAGYRSGARNAAKHARALGRKLFVVPSAPWIGSGRGCIAELKGGAALLESAKDALAYLKEANLHVLGPQLGLPQLGAQLGLPQLGAQASAPTPPGPIAVLAAIQAGANTYDAVCDATGLELPAVQRAVFDLRVAKSVHLDPSGFLLARKP